MSAARAKGTAAETAVVRWLAEHGWPHAERRALRGRHDRGDVSGLVGVVIEIKAHRTLDLPRWVDELQTEIANDRADTGLVVARRRGRPDPGDWYAVQPLHRAADLLKQAGY